MHDTGMVARITPEGKVEALYQAGRIVKFENPVGRTYVNLFAIERTIKQVAGVDDVAASIVYGSDNLFHIKATLKTSGEVDPGVVRKTVADSLGVQSMPDYVVVE